MYLSSLKCFRYCTKSSVFWSHKLGTHRFKINRGDIYFFMIFGDPLQIILTQPRSQALSSPKRKTLVGSGHVPPRF